MRTTLRVVLGLFLLQNIFAWSLEDEGERVIGGIPAEIDEFPYMAALGWINNETRNVDYLGGAFLISPNFVLTAAHCVLLKGKSTDRILIGGNYLEEGPNEIHTLKKLFIYPEYSDRQAYHDIALLQLNRESAQPPVCLWTEPELHTTNVSAIGYGLTEFAGSMSTNLLKVNLTVYPEDVCGPYFKRQRKFPSGILPSHLCAGDPERRRDTCQGDSGGPLMVTDHDKLYAAGITSTGQACSGFPPAVYTRISSYIDWIKMVIAAEGSSIPEKCSNKNQ